MHHANYCMGVVAVSQNTGPQGPIWEPLCPTNDNSLTFDQATINARARQAVMIIIATAPGGGSIKRRTNWAARLLGLPLVRVVRYYKNRVQRVEAHEYLQIIARAQLARREAAQRYKEQYLRLCQETPDEVECLVALEVELLDGVDTGYPADDF